MRKIFILIALIVFMLTLTGIISPTASNAEDKSCWFEAREDTDVYFIVRERTGSGGDREYVMWEGWVKRNEKKKYVSKTGQVRYDYKTSRDGKIIGDNHAACKNENIISIR
ncbi:MAG: hypothetical protein PVG35_17735 [Desulfobacterales bacterium]